MATKKIEPAPPLPPIPHTPVISTIIQYAFLIVVVVAAVWLYRIGFWHRFTELPAMSSPAVLFFALASAFTWVEVLKWGVIKPFNCVKCLSGWFALIFALLFHVEHWYLYLFGGLFVGAMYSGIKMRWL